MCRTTADSSPLVAITAEGSFYILRFDQNAYNAKVEGAEITDEGVGEAFEAVAKKKKVPEVSLKLFLSFNN